MEAGQIIESPTRVSRRELTTTNCRRESQGGMVVIV